MDNFRTIIDIPPSKQKISHSSKTLMMGSCFTENIGAFLVKYKFDVKVNPFGILYNPSSIKNSLEMLMGKKQFNEKDLFFANGLWNSFYHHSRFSDENLNDCLNTINSSIKESNKQLKTSDYLYITFGTSFIYKLINTGKTVSNCHKIPSKDFTRERLSVTEIVDEYSSLIKHLIEFNPNIKIIFTLSPVRHWKDGAVDNQLSKAILLVVIHRLKEMHSFVDYFPAYELMMDDLRDYRFYEKDMIHPNATGIEYIWKKFRDSQILENSIEIIFSIKKINDAMNHRPFNYKLEEHKKFLKSQLENILVLEQKYPSLDFQEEKIFFSAAPISNYKL